MIPLSFSKNIIKYINGIGTCHNKFNLKKMKGIPHNIDVVYYGSLICH
jgi:hypothetical protein